MTTQNIDSPTSNFKLDGLAIEINGEAYSFNANHLLFLRYIENIRSATIKMVITLTDTATGVLSKVEGMEPVVVSFSDHEDNNITLQMVVYDVQDRQIQEGRSKISILLCSQDVMNNASTKVSRRFGKGEGKDIGTMVDEDILVGLLATQQNIDVEKSMNKLSFISNFWDPFTIIKWLAARAIPSGGSGQNASCGYAFFGTKSGYKFWSYDKLAGQSPTTDAPSQIMVGYQKEENEDLGNKLVIDSIDPIGSTDVLQGLNYGSYNSLTITLDLADMKYEEHPFNITKYYDSVARLNPDKQLPKYYSGFEKDERYTRIMTKLLDTALFTEGTFTQDVTKQVSQAALREILFYNKSVDISFTGKLDYEVGQVVELMHYVGRDKKPDPTNGKYIIGHITREYSTSTDEMITHMLLYTDNPGNY